MNTSTLIWKNIRLGLLHGIIACSALTVSPGAANAALVDRGGGLIYDTDLNVTWLADGNYAMTSGYDANGSMTWSGAMAWASSLSYYDSARNITYDDWRLPTTTQPDPACSNQSGGYSWMYNCTGSEMGHLFYNELGGAAGMPLAVIHNTNYNLFQNIQSGVQYWSGTVFAPYPVHAWCFFSDLAQSSCDKSDAINVYALAVRTGDVAAVPVPAAVWLFGSGLLGLIGVARRKHAA